MTHHRHGEGDGPDASEGRHEERGPRHTGGPAAGPGREPGREAPSGRPAGEGPGTAGPEGSERPGSGEPSGESEPAGGAGAGEGAGEGHGRRGARRAWGDAFSEVQDLVGEVVGDVLEGVRDAASGRFPRMDLVRVEGEGYRLLIDLPGMRRDDVEVVTLGNELTVKGERPRPDLPEGSEILRSERAHGRFERTIRMPPEVREEAVSATFEDGVLTVRLPKAERDEARRVDIG